MKPESPDDRRAYYSYGEEKEIEFCEKVAPMYGLDATINPLKVNDKYAIDLVVNGELADLKTVETPFFYAKDYGVDPDFAVTLNVKDVERYIGTKMLVIFRLNWGGQEKYGIRVQGHRWVYSLELSGLIEDLKTNPSPIHFYKDTRKENKNAMSSFVLDTRKMYQYTLVGS